LTHAPAPVATDPLFDTIRTREFARLNATGHAYLDYGGSALYGASQVATHAAMLETGIFGNPHSAHEPSRASSAMLETARERVLRYFDVDASTHAVCFTANATGAIKLVAESYPFDRHAVCVLAADNHNSVNGIREYARRGGAAVHYLPLDGELRLDEPAHRLRHLRPVGGGLLAYPAQSNFSGVRHPMQLVTTAQEQGLRVLLDAAALVSSSALSLRTCTADFVAISFYKLFGYPTGIGALIATHEALAALNRPWFAGGTVDYASVQHQRHQLRAGSEGFEDGTPAFLAAAALPAGFDLLESVGLARLGRHLEVLAGALTARLQAIRHSNGARAIRLYGPADRRSHGGTIALNVLTRDGLPMPYQIVEERMRAAGVSVRGGCFCNPGAAEAAFDFHAAATARCFDAAGEDFSVERFATCLGPRIAVGAVRISMGLATNLADVARASDVLESFVS